MVSLGQNGVKIATGITETGNFYAVQALEDASINAEVNWKNADPLETITIDAGSVIYGVFTSINTTSGTVVAFE